MKTTLNLNDELMRQIKVLAVESGLTLTDLIQDSLWATLDHVKRQRAAPPFKVKTWDGGGLRPGLTWESFDDTSALLDLIESRDLGSPEPGLQG